VKKNIDLQAKLGFDRFSGLYLFVVFIIMFAIWAPNTFLTASTLHSVASSQAVAGIIALAVLIPITAGQYDLSVGANANIAGITAILLQSEKHWSVPATVTVCVLIGLSIGVVNALVVVGLRVNSFIATLAMGSILSATQVIITNNAQPQPVLAAGWNNLTQRSIGGFQIVVLYLII
jgi:ribose transport system permease protein